MSQETDFQAHLVSTPPIQQSDLTFKCIMLGEAGVGKTTLFKRITSSSGRQRPQHNHQRQNRDANSSSAARTTSTVSCDMESRNVLLPSGFRVRLDLWDTAGLERLHSLTESHYRGAKAVFLVYDAAHTNRTKQHLDDVYFRFHERPGSRAGSGGGAGGGGRFSLESLDSLDSNVLVFLLANKIDQGEDFVLTESGVENLSQAARMPVADHFRVSGLTGQGVEEAVRTVAQGLLATRQKSCQDETPRSPREIDTVRLEVRVKQHKKKKCVCA